MYSHDVVNVQSTLRRVHAGYFRLHPCTRSDLMLPDVLVLFLGRFAAMTGRRTLGNAGKFTTTAQQQDESKEKEWYGYPVSNL